MINFSNYIENGKVNRTDIANDIASGYFSESDLHDLLSNIEVKNAFFSNTTLKKIDNSQWDQVYLNKLVCMPVSEIFNEEYLRYLFEVSQYVFEKRQRTSKFLKIAIGIGVGIILILIVTLVLYKNHRG